VFHPCHGAIVRVGPMGMRRASPAGGNDLVPRRGESDGVATLGRVGFQLRGLHGWRLCMVSRMTTTKGLWDVRRVVREQSPLSVEQARFAGERGAYPGGCSCLGDGSVFFYHDDELRTVRWLVDRSGRPVDMEMFFRGGEATPACERISDGAAERGCREDGWSYRRGCFGRFCKPSRGECRFGGVILFRRDR
jgi:hypothetical protein